MRVKDYNHQISRSLYTNWFVTWDAINPFWGFFIDSGYGREITKSLYIKPLDYKDNIK